jgi:hypothetical protein
MFRRALCGAPGERARRPNRVRDQAPSSQSHSSLPVAASLRYVFLDNHAHQLHHCVRGNLINHGVIFSVWDRLFGTYYEDRRLSPCTMVKEHVALPILPRLRAGQGPHIEAT